MSYVVIALSAVPSEKTLARVSEIVRKYSDIRTLIEVYRDVDLNLALIVLNSGYTEIGTDAKYFDTVARLLRHLMHRGCFPFVHVMGDGFSPDYAHDCVVRVEAYRSISMRLMTNCGGNYIPTHLSR